MGIKAEGMGKFVEQNSIKPGCVFSAWLHDQPVLCICFGVAGTSDQSKALVLAAKGVPTFTTIDLGDLGGPRVIPAGDVAVRPAGAGLSGKAYRGAELGDLGIDSQGTPFLMIRSAKGGLNLRSLNLATGMSDAGGLAYYVREWELVMHMEDRAETVLAKFPLTKPATIASLSV